MKTNHMNKPPSLLLCVLASSYLVGCAAMNKSTSNDKPAEFTIEASSQAKLISANSAEQYNELGRRYQQAGNHNMATVAYQKALQLAPNNATSIAGLASGYAQQNMLSVAIPLFEKAVSLSPSASAYNNLGYAYYLNQQYEEAGRVLIQAILLDPLYDQAKNNLALVEANLSADKSIKQLAQQQNAVDYVVVNSQSTASNALGNDLANLQGFTNKPAVKAPELLTSLVAEQQIKAIKVQPAPALPVETPLIEENKIQQQAQSLPTLSVITQSATTQNMASINVTPHASPVANLQQTTSNIYELRIDEKNVNDEPITNGEILAKTERLTQPGQLSITEKSAAAAHSNAAKPLVSANLAETHLIALPSLMTSDAAPISKNNQTITEQKQLFAAVSGGITFKHVPVVSQLFDLATTGMVAMQASHQHPYMEVINGNGLKGIAKAVAGQLNDRGIARIKVADAKRFNLSKTHIQYRSGYRANAHALNQNLMNRPYLMRNDQLPNNVSVRLVLGRDLLKAMSKAEIASISHVDIASI